MFAPVEGDLYMPAEFNKAAPIDQLKLVVIEQVKETNDISLLDTISQILLLERSA
jgi:hypothetical protein